jgi:hypothetical protein
MGGIRNAYKTLVENLKESHLGDLVIDGGKINLKRM